MADKLPRTKELRALAEPELAMQLEKLRQELWQLHAKKADGSLQQAHHLRTMRRQMARIHTILRERP